MLLVDKQVAKPQLKLHSRDVEQYRSDQLYKLIPEIVNPGYTSNLLNAFLKTHNHPAFREEEEFFLF